MNDSTPDTPLNDGDENAPSAAELEAAGQSALFAEIREPKPSAADKGDESPAAEAQVQAGEGTANPSPAPSEPAEPATAQPYRVLARKYRPQTFSQLIGQEPMVRTLANAIERDRLAHAFLMTGVRGVGKTSTARLIAKALNCIGPDGTGGPTIDPCGVCEPCRAIAEGRHIDVIEMDAASHTGVDDVREIIAQVRYAAVSARYKIYIIDEVHMLSRNAFNALLKTLEEPPAHVKFLFATTEVDKLPITVLSRTQRFDLRRIPAAMLADHFAHVCQLEGVSAEDEALAIIAGAAEGSVRDGLSILDQAIAHADLDEGGAVSAARVRDMLGLADKSAQRALLTSLLDGDAQALLAQVDEQYALGVEPLALIRAIMDLVHRITVGQIAGAAPRAPSSEESAALGALGEQLSPAQLHRLWQLLLKGHEEVRIAPDPLVSLQMALLRVLHAGTMPDPGELARRLETMANAPVSPDSSPSASAPASGAQGEAQSSPSNQIEAAVPQLSWRELVDQVNDAGHLRVAQMMRDRVRVVKLGSDHLLYQPADSFPDDPAPDIRDALLKVTGRRWTIERVSEREAGEPGDGQSLMSLREEAEAKSAAERAAVLAHPMVKAAIEAFPEAELIDHPKTAAG